MGVATTGLLFFGFDICNEEEGDELPFDPYEWEDFYAEQVGVRDKSGFYTPEGVYAFPKGSEEYEKREKEHDKFYKLKQRLIKETGVTIDAHCGSEYPIWYVALEKPSFAAPRGYPVIIRELPVITMADVDRMKAFCKVMKIDFKKPSWTLASYWG